jgi:UDP-GlcNAc:undecaprenyl-phosphate GlcNAc-1-phosphate transferase
MNTYLALFLIATCGSLVLTPLLRRLCERYRLVDEPGDGRRIHVKSVPRLGGIAIFVSALLALSVLPLKDNLLTQTLRADSHQFLALLVCATLVLLLGVFDDLRGANAKVKFAVLSAVTTLFWVMGGRIAGLSIPFVGGVNLPPVLGFVLTLLWVVGITNAFNLIDGIDGLATGSALFALLVILVISLVQGNAFVTVVALALSGALAGFLRYNFNPASIFLGDSGALFVGFSLAALSIQGAQKASTAVAVAIPIFAFALPVVDTVVTIGRRFVSGKPIFQGDRGHIHHMLLSRGWSQRRVALSLYAVSALFGLLAMLFVSSSSQLTATVLFVVGIAVVTAVGHLRYPEVAEIRASVKRNIGERRARAANNIRIRRACQTLAQATTLDELFGEVSDMLDFGEFVYANVQLSYHGRPIADGATSQAVVPDGRIQWAWQREGSDPERIVGSDRFWTLRLPLATARGPLGYINLYRALDDSPMRLDVNYLCALFQPEMSQAAERILESEVRGQRSESATDEHGFARIGDGVKKRIAK